MKALCFFLFALGLLTDQTIDANLKGGNGVHYEPGGNGFPPFQYQLGNVLPPGEPGQFVWSYYPVLVHEWPEKVIVYHKLRGYGRNISDEKGLEAGLNHGVVGSVSPLDPTALPDFDFSTVDIENEITIPATADIVLYGITLKQGNVKVHKITITKISEGRVRVKTPDGIFLAPNFSLSKGDLGSTIAASQDGKPTRLLYINHQDGSTDNFLKTDGGQLGFIDLQAIDADSYEKAVKQVEEFFKRAGAKAKEILALFFQRVKEREWNQEDEEGHTAEEFTDDVAP